MAQVIDLEGLPAPVARAIAETVINLKNRYRVNVPQQDVAKRKNELPSRPGRVIGNVRRVEIYNEPR